MDPQEQMPDPLGDSVTHHHTPGPFRNTINHNGRSKQPPSSFEGAPYNTTLISPLQTITFPLCSTAPIQFHPADGDQYTRHMSPYLRRSACLSGMGEHRHLSFSYYSLVMIPTFFCTKFYISKDEFTNFNATRPRQTMSREWSVLAGVERYGRLSNLHLTC